MQGRGGPNSHAGGIALSEDFHGAVGESSDSHLQNSPYFSLEHIRPTAFSANFSWDQIEEKITFYMVQILPHKMLTMVTMRKCNII